MATSTRFATLHEGLETHHSARVMDRQFRMKRAAEVTVYRQTPTEDDGAPTPDDNLTIKVTARTPHGVAIAAALSLNPSDARQLAEIIFRFFPEPIKNDVDASEEVISALVNFGMSQADAERKTRIASQDLRANDPGGRAFDALFKRATELRG